MLKNFCKLNLTPQNCFKFIYKLTTIVGQTPNWDFSKNSPIKTKILLKIFIYTLYLVLNVVFVLKMQLAIRSFKSIVLYLIISKNVLITLQTMLITFYCCSKKWTILMPHLIKCLYKQSEIDYKICVQFLTCNFLFLIPFIGQIYVSTLNINWTYITYTIFFLSLFNEYLNFLNGCTIFNILWIFNKNYLQLTNLLKLKYGNRQQINYDLTNLIEIYTNFQTTNKYALIFNQLFGNIMLIKCFTVGIHLLSTFFNNTAFFSPNFDISPNDLMQFFINNSISINNFISISILLFSYQTVQNNARIVPNYCFRIIEKCFQQKICHILCFSLVREENLPFSANRFFFLNKGAIFGLLSNVITYLIVAIQMKM